MSLHFFLLFIQLAAAAHASHHPFHNNNNNKSNQLCGSFEIPLFPFYLLDYSGTLAFSLSCINSSTLFLNISSQSYRVLHIFPDGVLVDFPNITNDLSSLTFSGSEYFGISTDNVLGLYDCEDSSLCRPNSCLNAGSHDGPVPSCCYPLSDHSAWQPGESLSVFTQMGCTGISSWVVLPTATGRRPGIKLEWAVPRNSTTCVTDADVINATSVRSGIRCRCHDGFVGDGFTIGVGCRKSCFKDGTEISGNDCHQNNHGRKKAIILAGGVITSVLAVVSLAAICLMKWHVRSDKLLSDQSPILSEKSYRPPRLFTPHELQEATKEFGDGQKIVGGTKSSSNTMYAGVLIGEGSHSQHVAVQRVRCRSEIELTSVLFRVEALTAVSHRNIAHVIGWSVDSGLTPLVVYDFSGNGTLRELLLLPATTRDKKEHFSPLDWHTRLNIASETATILAFMQNEVSPPIFHHDLQSGHIFLDVNFSVKLAGFDLKNEDITRNNDVYSLGVILLEIITGDAMMVDFATIALRKIEKGKLEEIVDPNLYYHEQPLFRREQIEIIADLATRCVLFGGTNGKLGMTDVARELAHMIKKEGKVPVLEETFSNSSLLQMVSVVSLEETFSNSSLLQMISMSPDSIYVPQQLH